MRLPDTQPFVTYIILGLTILVFLAQLGTESLLGVDLPAAYGVKSNELIALGQYWRLFTPMLLHGSIMHVAFNMYALLILGPGLEQSFGRMRFLALYLLAGFAGNVFSMTFTPAPSLGSSTSIFGLLAAQGVFLYLNRSLFGWRARNALTNILTIAGINFFIGLSPGIDNWGHLGGFVAGGVFSLIAGPVLEVRMEPTGPRFDDQRGGRDLIVAGFLVGGLFTLLAALVVLMRM